MRTPKRIVPNEKYTVSLVLGVLVPFAVIALASDFPEMLYKRTLLFLPFICGFTAAFVFGGRRRRVLLVGGTAYVLFLVGLIASLKAFGVPTHRTELGIVLFAAIFPPFCLVPLGISVVGAICGWVVAAAAQR